MARLPETKDCAIRGCTYAGSKGGLCERHWNTIPMIERTKANLAMIGAQLRERDRQHARLRRLAREIDAGKVA